MKQLSNSRTIAILMLVTFLISSIEGFCFQSKKSINKDQEIELSFESNQPDHMVEATINETFSITRNETLGTNEREFSIPDLLSFITSNICLTSIVNYEHTISSIYFSNRLFLIFSHFTI